MRSEVGTDLVRYDSEILTFSFCASTKAILISLTPQENPLISVQPTLTFNLGLV